MAFEASALASMVVSRSGENRQIKMHTLGLERLSLSVAVCLNLQDV